MQILKARFYTTLFFSESYRIFASGIYVFTKIDFYEINDIENAGKYIREYM